MNARKGEAAKNFSTVIDSTVSRSREISDQLAEFVGKIEPTSCDRAEHVRRPKLSV